MDFFLFGFLSCCCVQSTHITRILCVSISSANGIDGAQSDAGIAHKWEKFIPMPIAIAAQPPHSRRYSIPLPAWILSHFFSAEDLKELLDYRRLSISPSQAMRVACIYSEYQTIRLKWLLRDQVARLRVWLWCPAETHIIIDFFDFSSIKIEWIEYLCETYS